MSEPRKPQRRRIAGERSAADRSASTPPSPRATPRPVARPVRRPLAEEPASTPPPPTSASGRQRTQAAAEDTGSERSTGARRPRLPVGSLPWRMIIAVIVLALGLGLAGWGAWSLRGGGEAALDAAQRQASRAAGEAAETIFTFSHDDLDDHEESSKALMTEDFAEEFDKVAPSLRDIAPQREFEVQAQVQDAGAVPCGDDCSTESVQVLVFVDQVRLIAGQEDEAPTVLGNRVTMTMVKERGTWLVDEIQAL
ncbi:hypothetical protein BHE97_17930 [Aeromicrobium sp. PE09-221]|uniref:hypothetical protein n=1 Tax=Aeromicrobium sp. PE09-221 TaxID=1898043 RepID=UPI000B3EA2EE|nr:hypothetical protein [Aeromicrobium sp. PE09-221]OUZ07163.1 hypothetical protein BHE97_17930 [Aeromicrobium sp. PE09-221]